MNKNQLVRATLAVATALFVTGCSSSRQKGSYSHSTPEAQGAPALTQTTEVLTASGGVETNSQADIQLHKEEMVVGKRTVSNGGVLIRTVVQTEKVSQPIELNREEYVIERIPAGQAEALNSQNVFQGQEIYIPLTREEPLASKRALLSEKVQLGKRLETDRQTVSTPVRSEDVEITKVSGKAGGTYWQEPGAVAAAAPEANSLKLFREEMVVGKTSVDNGGVKLQKIVRTQTASQPIELQREEFTIDRTAAPEAQVVAGADFSPRQIRLDLSREEPVVSTRIQPTELVRVRKQVQTDRQTVSGTIRKENVEVVKLAGVEPAMGGTSQAGQSGATVLSESGTGRLMTITGNALCAKCQLHEAANCQNVIQVHDQNRLVNYYLVQDDVSNLVLDPQSFHENLCKQGKKVTATGSACQVDGKLAFTPRQIKVLD